MYDFSMYDVGFLDVGCKNKRKNEKQRTINEKRSLKQ